MATKKRDGRTHEIPVRDLSRKWIQREDELKQSVSDFKDIFIDSVKARELAEVSKMTLTKYTYDLMDENLSREDKVGKMPALMGPRYTLLFRDIFEEWMSNRTKGRK